MNDLPMIDTGPKEAPWRLILAHGAGAPMDSPFMHHIAEALGERGIGVRRFEFPYMALRRSEGRKKPPDRAPILLAAWRGVVERTAQDFPDALIAIGGKSMGGRMATMLAAEPDRPAQIRALTTLGYPFHPPGKPENTRVDHFPALELPILMLQGTRDPFGRSDEVPNYPLPPKSQVVWLEDGDHDLKPRKASGRTHDEALSEAVQAISDFLNQNQ